MRLGGPVAEAAEGPEEWISGLDRRGYTAAAFSLHIEHDEYAVREYAEAARSADVVIAEVGAWSNSISADEAVQREAVELCCRRLALADRVGARCCVNISGSRGEQWDGPHPDNLSVDTFALVVQTVREIIDAVHPTRTHYALEPMPWSLPDSPQAYLDLIRAVDRAAFAVHLDPINMISSPGCYYDTAGFLKECFKMLGPYIRSCHAKDITLSGALTVHLDEVRPGLGALDYGVYLRLLAGLDPDTPLLLEHLPSEDDYAAGAEYLRTTARDLGIVLR